jgi:1-acyl-sn-glycerol-3-phosphate acyltransferase
MVREAQVQFKKGNRQLLIFPEGTRGDPGKAGDYKPGIAALYRDLDLPVHPVATNSGVHWPAHGFLRRPGTIVFEYLEPIPPGLKRGEFMRILEERIETASNQLLSL